MGILGFATVLQCGILSTKCESGVICSGGVYSEGWLLSRAISGMAVGMIESQKPQMEELEAFLGQNPPERMMGPFEISQKFEEWKMKQHLEAAPEEILKATPEEMIEWLDSQMGLEQSRGPWTDRTRAHDVPFYRLRAIMEFIKKHKDCHIISKG